MAEDHDSIDIDLDTSKIKNWRSIITLIVFVLTNLVVLFPFHIPVFVPWIISDSITDTLSALRIIAPRQKPNAQYGSDSEQPERDGMFRKMMFPMNFVTAPLIADLFLLAILAIGRTEVHDGTIGANNISPIDIMAFFLTLAYIAVSIDASGLIRYLAFRVLKWGGEAGHRLFFYLYAFFFALGSFIGNDPIILSGTAFLAYMTRVSSNIVHPRAWIHTQFAIANIASAILVSSNPTNLVLAGAFDIKFIHYTANMIVPVVITAIVLFPFLLYIVFLDEALIPDKINIHELPEEARQKKPVNPNIPHARGEAEDQVDNPTAGEQAKLLPLEEIMNPFLDKGGAAFGAVIMAATLITLLAVNASSTSSGHYYVYWVTLPAAVVMLFWDIAFGWYHRHETRDIARKGREAFERAKVERAERDREEAAARRSPQSGFEDDEVAVIEMDSMPEHGAQEADSDSADGVDNKTGITGDDTTLVADSTATRPAEPGSSTPHTPALGAMENGEQPTSTASIMDEKEQLTRVESSKRPEGLLAASLSKEMDDKRRVADPEIHAQPNFVHPRKKAPRTLVSLFADFYRWCQETFPTVTAVLAHLPYELVPFAFAMFVLVQALVTKGWVQVFAYGWDHWVNKTGTVGAIGGMAFLSVILCNFAGTNIGTTILLSRVIQAWTEIHAKNGKPITDRTFWATVYSMALGVNYGAFSTAFSASLAGLLWRNILARKHIKVRRLEFARVNLPIIAIAMTVGCVVLIAEVYIVRDTKPYHL